jgi:hypothetical protein
VNDSLVVRCLEPGRDLPPDRQRLIDGNEALEAVDLCDVRMVERRQRARFTLEAQEPIRVCGKRLGKYLDGDESAERGNERAIHLAHAAFADLPDDLVDAEATTGGPAHRGDYRCLRDQRRDLLEHQVGHILLQVVPDPQTPDR